MKLLKMTAITAMLSLNACNYFMTGRSVTSSQGAGGGQPGIPFVKLTDEEIQKLTPAEITYELVKTNVLADSCMQCHTENGAFPDLTTEAMLKEHLVSVKELVEKEKMPPANKPKFAITEGQRKLLLNWIEKVQTPPVVVDPPPVVTPEPPPVIAPKPPAEPTLLSDEQVAALKESDLTYALVNKNAFEQSCLGCHSESAAKPKRPLLDTYARIVENKQIVYEAVQSEDMPPKGMVDVRRQLILKWLDLGAPLVVVPQEPPVTGGEPPVVIPNPPVIVPNPPLAEERILFAEVSAKVFAPHCIRCHGEGEDFDLNLEAHAKAAAESIKSEVVSKKMPKGKNNTLSDDQINLVVKWVDQGAN